MGRSVEEVRRELFKLSKCIISLWEEKVERIDEISQPLEAGRREAENTHATHA